MIVVSQKMFIEMVERFIEHAAQREKFRFLAANEEIRMQAELMAYQEKEKLRAQLMALHALVFAAGLEAGREALLEEQEEERKARRVRRRKKRSG